MKAGVGILHGTRTQKFRIFASLVSPGLRSVSTVDYASLWAGTSACSHAAFVSAEKRYSCCVWIEVTLSQ